MLNFDSLKTAPRLLAQAELEPVQGTRFQPTGFPNLGAAVYTLPDGTDMLLVESAQSMANRLETVCWDEARNDVVLCLKDMPYVRVVKGNNVLTNSLLEAHRLNSPYILGPKSSFNDFGEQLRKAIDYRDDQPFSLDNLVRTLLKFDPCSLIHGVFLEKIAGVLRIQRSLSGFIEAAGARVAASGGVKRDRVMQSKAAGAKAEEGTGNIIFARDEYVAEHIAAYFNLDLMQIRAFGLGDVAERFLIALALLKIQRFLDTGLRLRTACDLQVKGGLTVKRPEGFEVPSAAELEKVLPELIKGVAKENLFANPPITQVNYKD